jgi:RNA polymerase sigma-70 factor, ECF subfamily
MTAHRRTSAVLDEGEGAPAEDIALISEAVPRDLGEVREAPRRELPPIDHLYRDHATSVWRFLRRLGVPEPDVSDVCQEVFLAVHRQYPTYDGRCAIRTWLYSFCLRHASRYRRATRRRREDLVEVPPERALPPSHEADMDQRDAIRRLDAVLDTLDEDKRVAFVLYYVEEMALAEIATLTGCPLQTVYSRCRAAHARVEAALKRAGGGRS